MNLMVCRPKKRLDKSDVAQAPQTYEVCKSADFQDSVHKTCEAIVETIVRSHILMAQAPVALLELLTNPMARKGVSDVWVACAGQRVYSHIVHECLLCMGYCRRIQWSDRPDRCRKKLSTKASNGIRGHAGEDGARTIESLDDLSTFRFGLECPK